MNPRPRHDRCGLFAFALAFATSLFATDAAAILVVQEPWVRIAPDARAAEGYVRLRSSEDATLVGIRSDAAASAEIRQRGKSRASAGRIKLPAGETVMLAPGADRFVLSRLVRPMKLGDRVEFVLVVEAADGSRQEIRVSAEVRNHSPTEDHLHGHRH
jgi:periplasmic copper chaperone A